MSQNKQEAYFCPPWMAKRTSSSGMAAECLADKCPLCSEALLQHSPVWCLRTQLGDSPNQSSYLRSSHHPFSLTFTAWWAPAIATWDLSQNRKLEFLKMFSNYPVGPNSRNNVPFKFRLVSVCSPDSEKWFTIMIKYMHNWSSLWTLISKVCPCCSRKFQSLWKPPSEFLFHSFGLKTLWVLRYIRNRSQTWHEVQTWTL